MLEPSSRHARSYGIWTRSDDLFDSYRTITVVDQSAFSAL